jgi:ATP-dependent Lhr-like helicase
LFHPAVRRWFSGAFHAPTRAQQLGWPAIARGDSTLILAPTGSGKTLAAFMWCLDRLMFAPLPPPPHQRCRVLYISPLKALAVDVERNLRAPLVGITNAADAEGSTVTLPQIAIRTGDTSAGERAKFLREAADILITTPESLFLLLTSNARQQLTHIDTVIVDEIHALVPGKRGAHLALSLERLEALRATRSEGDRRASNPVRPLQRVGLSATQRPLEEVARFLGGAEAGARLKRRTSGGRQAHGKAADRDRQIGAVAANLHDEFSGEEARPAVYRPVTIINAEEKKGLRLRIEVPVESIAKGGRADSGALIRSGPADRALSEAAGIPTAGKGGAPSIWASVHPRLLELIRAHRSTLLFVNSRRLAERLAAALNELAGELLVRSHHGSLARSARSEVEDLLKAGRIRALVATSSLELGIDMGAIDLVVQIEAPPSVASGLQRIGRAGHHAGAVSDGIIFPKFRGDLVACAAVARAMHDGHVEATRYPRNPLDVLAQQIVAIAASDSWPVDDLFDLVRRAAPFTELSRGIFEGVLDMLSGRYPSDEFAELRPRITWDRVRGTVVGREGAKRVAIANAGTIPDRGLYGVFLAGADRPTRVGELDEEMVFETQVGDTFTLGASTWRVEEITHDRVLVTPAPGEPGKMPFWHGDQAGRPVELGRAIGLLVRELRAMPRPAAVDRLVRQHDLDVAAAEQMLRYLNDQATAGAVPDDRTIVIERCLDELGDWRVCVLSHFGSRIHAPWAMAVTADIRSRTGMNVETMWGDEGFVVRFPEVDRAPDSKLLLPDVEDVEALVLRQLGSTSLFAARFRETAARALLLPKRRPGMRTPLWQQRKRAADLLAVASRFGSFPAVLETYREVLRDYFDMPALVEILRKISTRTLRVTTIDSRTPSPFAASLLFSYVANYIYDGDAPLAERRAQALSVDQAQLRELLGDAELRELLDADALDAMERQLQHLDDKYKVRTADGLHDVLIRIGDLSPPEIVARSVLPDTAAVVRDLEQARRIVRLTIAGEQRLVAAEDAARYRDALGVPLPPGLPESLLAPVRDPAGDLVLRYARSHAPFTVRQLAARYGLGPVVVESLLLRLGEQGRVVEGEFRPGGTEREWVDEGVLRSLRRRSLARLRKEIEPVEADALGRFCLSWHGVGAGRRGLEALLDAIEQLQGAPIPASGLETDVLPARVEDYEPSMLDMLLAAGEASWIGIEPLGDRDGRMALYLTDHLRRLRQPAVRADAIDAAESLRLNGRAKEILNYLRAHGASFFGPLHDGSGGGFPQETVDVLWDLVWQGIVTNDTLHPLRAFIRGNDPPSRRRAQSPPFRSRRLVPPKAEGRWSLIETPRATKATLTEWSAATAQQLLTRYGVVTRETTASEAVAGGFSAVYDVLKTMEETGRIRRGYFVAGLGGAQFATPAAVDLLRAMREPAETAFAAVLAATDPANPYGAILRWPDLASEQPSSASPPADLARGPTRSVGARVILVDGFLGGYLRRGERELLLFAPKEEPRRSQVAREVARILLHLALSRDVSRRGMLLSEINGESAIHHSAAAIFAEEGFIPTAMGLQARADRHRGAASSRSEGDPPSGTHIAGALGGGNPMAEQPRPGDDRVDTPDLDETRDMEQERIRSSNDRDQAMERVGEIAPHNRGYDKAVRGHGVEDVDPDSAESDVDRDDTVTD